MKWIRLPHQIQRFLQTGCSQNRYATMSMLASKQKSVLVHARRCQSVLFQSGCIHTSASSDVEHSQILDFLKDLEKIPKDVIHLSDKQFGKVLQLRPELLTLQEEMSELQALVAGEVSFQAERPIG